MEKAVFDAIRKAAVPPPVKHASLLMLSYALVILVGTLWFALQNEFMQTREFFRGLLRVAGMTGLAFWLLTLDKRAWWFAIAACSFFAALGIVGIIALGFAGVTFDRSLLWLALRVVVPVYLLGHAAIILGRRDTRQLFRTITAEARRG